MAQKERDYTALTRAPSSGDLSESWVRLQKKAFTAWCNEHLRKRDVYIGDLGTELVDGVKLLHLLEVLSTYKVENGKWVKAPKTRFEKLQNVSWGLKFMTAQGIKIVAIGPEDLVDPKLKLILGLIWLLILKYLVSKGGTGGSAKADTIAWVRKRTGNDAVKDFNPQTWQDGRLYCGIIHSMKPDERINPANLNPAEGLKNIQTAMKIAEDDLGVPHILDPEDILAPEELSFITYLSILRDKGADLDSGKVATPRTAPKEAETPRAKDYHSVISCDPAAPVVGDPVTFKVQLKESGGPLVIKGGQNFKANLTDPTGAAIANESKDNNDGTWLVRWRPTKGGDHKLAVTVDDKPTGAPFIVNVSGGGADPSKCTLALSPASPVPVGTIVTATLQLVDSSGAKLSSVANTSVRAILAAPDNENALIFKDGGNGAALFTFTPTKAGDHSLRTFVANKPSATGGIAAVDSASSDNSSVEFSPPKPKVGEKVTAKLTVKDNAGKTVTPAATAIRAVVAAPGGENALPLAANSDGTFSGSFTPAKAGEHTVKAFVSDKPVKPVSVNVAAGISAEKSDVKLDPTEPATGDNVTVTVQLSDDAGKEADGTDAKVEGVLKAPDGDKPLSFAAVKPASAGKFTASFTPKSAGDYSVAPSVNGAPISPASVAVKAAVDAGSSKLAVTPASPVEGDEVTAKLTLHGKDGSTVAPAGNTADAKISGPDGKPVASTTAPEGDGFAIKFSAKSAGAHKIAPSVNGEATPEKTVQVAADVDAKGTTVAIDPSKPVLNDKVNAKIRLFNRHGKPRTTGGPKVIAKVASPSGKTDNVPVTDNGDGTYSLSFSANAVGTFTITPSVNDDAAPAASVPVTSNVDASRASVSISPKEPVVGDKCTATVQLKDPNGAPLTSSAGVSVKASLSAAGGQPSDIAISDNKDGSFKIEFTPTVAGKHEVSSTVNDAPVPPASVDVKPNVDATKSILYVDPAAPTAGDKAKATVKLVDSKGKPLTAGGVPVEATFVSPDGKEIPVKVVNNGDGTYTVDLPIDKPGEYTLNVNVAGNPLAPAKFPVKPSLDAGKSSVYVDPAHPVAGEKTKATVKLVDADGTPVQGKVSVEATLIGPDGNEILVKVVENGDGNFTIDLPIDKPGEYTLNVTADGKPLSPLKFGVKPNVDAKKSTVNVDPAAPTAGDKAKATVTLVDSQGKLLTAGGVPVTASLIGPDDKEIPVKVVDNGDGTFSVELPTDKPGDYTLNIKADGKPLAPVKVSVAPNVDASKSSATGEGLKQAVVGRPAPFACEAKNKQGKVAPDAQFTVTVVGAGKVLQAEEKPKNNFAYVASEPGQVTVTVKVADQNVPGSPFTVSVLPAADPSKTETTFSPAVPHQGDKVAVKIQLKDVSGNPITYGSNKVTAGLLTPGAAKLEDGKVADNGDGTYVLHFNADHVGPHVVEPKVNDKAAPASEVVVKPAADPAQCKAHGPGLRHAVIGRQAEFFVEALNAHGKRVDGVQAHVAIKSDKGPLDVKQPQQTGKVPHQGHGHALVHFTPTSKGLHQVDITVEDKPIHGSPYRVSAELPPDAKNTDVAVTPAKPVVGDKIVAKVTLKDAEGNPIAFGGEKLEAVLIGPNGEVVPVEVKDNSDGTFTVTSGLLAKPGDYKLSLKVNDSEAPAKTVKVAPPVDLTKCKAKGDGLSKAIVGKKSEFTLIACDKDDKPLAGVPFTVTITGPKGETIPAQAAAVSGDDGEIHVSYVATAPGQLTIKAQHNGGDLKGSPFTVTAKKPPAAKRTRSNWTFEVELVDEDGNDLTEGGDEVALKMFDVKTPATLLPVAFKNVDANVYRLKFTLPQAGEYEIQVTVGGEHIAGSPFRQVAHT